MKFEEIQAAYYTAMKSKDKAKKEALSNVIGAVKNAGILKGIKDGYPDDLVISVIQKEIKTVKEQIDTCPADRTELLNIYSTRLNIYNEFAPVMLDRDSIIKEIVDFVLPVLNKENVVLEKSNRGLIMKQVMPLFKGRADSKLVSQIVEEMLV